MTPSTPSPMETIARQARLAARPVSYLESATKNAVLTDLANRISDERAAILQANALDMDAARSAGVSPPKLRRLELTTKGIDQLVTGLTQVVRLRDPVGVTTQDAHMPNGLHVRRVRSPLGVVMMIYEARPNVTIDAFSLCFKAGNACVLKGGREASRTNRELIRLCHEALEPHGVPTEAVTLVDTSDREQLLNLLSQDKYIDLVIPRGGKELIRFVRDHSKIPTIQHFEGVCHIFVDASADLEKAVDVCATAKTSAPATCNAVECLLIHDAVADAFLPKLVERLTRDGVEIRGDERVQRISSAVRAAQDDDWGKEFLDLIVAVKVVADLEAAIAHITQYSSSHTEAILTQDDANAREFTTRVQSSVVLVNASTRFNDGFSLGLGAEIGISTTRLHAYGPMGLEELTTLRYIVEGSGHTR